MHRSIPALMARRPMWPPLLAVALVAVASTLLPSLAKAGQEEIERFLREYPAAAAAIEGRLSTIRGTCHVETSRLIERRTPTVYRAEFAQSGGRRKGEFLYGGRSEGIRRVISMGPSSGFGLHRLPDDPAYKVDAIDLSDQLERQYMHLLGRFLNASYCLHGPPLTAYMRDPTFKVESAEPVREGGRDCMEVAFRNGGSEGLGRSTVVLDPGLGWVIRSAEIGAGRAGSVRYQMDYGPAGDAAPLPLTVVSTEPHGVISHCRFDKPDWVETPASEFGMPAYGLPDLTVPAPVGGPRGPWVLLVGTAALAGGVVVALRIASRRAR